MSDPVTIREARETDAESIRDVFVACYGDKYSHPSFLHVDSIKQMIYDREVIVLVAEDNENGRVVGTASVVLDIGAWGDLIGEFGRLAVHPDARGKKIGGRLMEGRLEKVNNRLHVGIVENRVAHPYSQKISDRHGFVPVGLLPSRQIFADRETVALYGRHFGDALKLRRNHPRVIPEAWPLADEVLKSCGIKSDAIADTGTAAYANTGQFDIEELTSEEYTSLLHLERGRVRQREIIGPVKLHAGIFHIRVSHYQYLLAKRDGHLMGGIGYFISEKDKSARILELVSVDAVPIRFLIDEVVGRFENDPGVEYVEVDVSAHAAAMQRTFLELGFLPAAYVPAMCFHRVERLDGIRMVRLFVPLDFEGISLHERTRPVADLVMKQFQSKEIDPQIAEAVPGTSLFEGLNSEQSNQLAKVAGMESFSSSETIFEESTEDGKIYLVLEGCAVVRMGNGEPPVGEVGPGEVLGELSLLHGVSHRATATAKTDLSAAVFPHSELTRLIRARPDIGVIVYRNLASQLGGKLLRTDLRDD